MVKKDTKAKAAEKKAKKAAQQSKKVGKREKKDKRKRKDQEEDDESEDEDLDTILQEYAKQQAQFLKVTETASDPPPARSSATLLGSPTSSNELFLFGGEYFNGATASFYNDLYVYLINKSQWRRVTSPNSPLPRSGHAWCRGDNAGGIYLFGGEFSSPKQGTFYHYNDFWRLEPGTREWQRIESKGSGPPARSGHRMTYLKNYIVLFGGFQDTSQQTKYLQDLWLYDTAAFAWFSPTLPPASPRPDPRSSFSLLPHDNGAAMYGGYSRVKSTAVAGKRSKGGGGQATRVILKPVVHQDAWFLRITPPGEGSPANAPPAVRWERRKKPANAPQPPRAGATMVYHRSRGIAFGGVHDVEESEEGIDSEFFDTLHAWNIDRNRFFPLALRRPRAQGKKAVVLAERGGKRERGKADEEELLRNLAALGAKALDGETDAMEAVSTTMKSEEERADAELVDQPVQYAMPHPRFNAALGVQDDVLYIYGGTYEHGDREYTFDEMYAIDLGKLDGVKQIFHREVENWVATDEDEGESGDEEDEDEDEDEDMAEAPTPGVAPSEPVEEPPVPETPSEMAPPEEEEQKTETADTLPHPRPFESLRDFFARTSNEWQQILIVQQSTMEVDSDTSVKELRKKAFERAEGKWWDCREEIMALEDEQEEAGIGEVVSISERGEGGPLRRR